MGLQPAIARLRQAADWTSELNGDWAKALQDTLCKTLATGSQMARDLADAIEALAEWRDAAPAPSPVEARTCQAIHAHLAALCYTVAALREMVHHERCRTSNDTLDDCEDALEGLALRVQQLERLIRRTMPCQA